MTRFSRWLVALPTVRPSTQTAAAKVATKTRTRKPI
jgi:hypothetical protein